jgi:hypothetical protein
LSIPAASLFFILMTTLFISSTLVFVNIDVKLLYVVSINNGWLS